MAYELMNFIVQQILLLLVHHTCIFSINIVHYDISLSVWVDYEVTGTVARLTKKVFENRLRFS